MRGKNNKRRGMILWLSVFLLLFSSVLLIGTTFARYRSIYRSAGTIDMSYGFSNSGIYMICSDTDENGDFTEEPVVSEEDSKTYLTPGKWTAVSDDFDVYELHFLLSNESEVDGTASYGQDGFIQLFATEGIEADTNITITLQAGDDIYTATPEEAEAGTAIYDSYGPGWVYKFKNRINEEISWYLPANISTQIPMTLTVSGAVEYPAALSVISYSKPAK